ncbi:MAG: hypothetical protein EA369_04530 [Bradymonadales bacterium]|nr:MAG: hypothetical protein EA369_04530 [Bradymonadales bacterium]
MSSFKSTWQLALVLFLSACSDAGFLAFQSENCQISVGQSCQASFRGGKFEWRLEGENLAGSEFYLVVFNNSELRHEDLSRDSFLVQSQPSSAPLHPEEARLTHRVRARSVSFASNHYLHFNLPGPANIFGPSFNTSFYIPDPQDYGSLDPNSGERTNWFVRESNNIQTRGRKLPMEPIYEVSGSLRAHLTGELLPEDIPSNAAARQTIINRYLDGVECAHQEIQWMKEVLGPLKPRGKTGIDLLIIPFEKPGVLGMFQHLDRFSHFRGQPLIDSNFAQTLYVSSALFRSQNFPRREQQFCSTSVHEYQHAYNFDRKVLEKRSSFDYRDMSGLRMESSGINEAKSHHYEELSERYQEVFKHRLSFLRNPMGTTLAHELATDNSNDFRSRGINILLLDFVHARNASRLRRDDTRTLNTLKGLIDSPEVGIRNIANHFNEREFEFLSQFFRSWILALHSLEGVRNFTPPLEQEGGNTQGIHILDRFAAAEEIPFVVSPYFHPLEADIPLLQSSQTQNLRASGIAVYRFILPGHVSSEPRISVSTRGAPFLTQIIRTQ